MSVLEVRDLNVTFRQEGRRIEAVKGVSFTVNKGETVALVGESGSSKSVTALSTVGLLSDNAEIAGSVELAFREFPWGFLDTSSIALVCLSRRMMSEAPLLSF